VIGSTRLDPGHASGDRRRPILRHREPTQLAWRSIVLTGGHSLAGTMDCRAALAMTSRCALPRHPDGWVSLRAQRGNPCCFTRMAAWFATPSSAARDEQMIRLETIVF
jgi:hypothetical protein